MNDLRGTYTGVYTPNSGGQGQLTLKITQDKLKNGNRSIKATAKFGNKSYKLQGALTEATRQLNLGGTSGRPPQITFVTVTGYFNEGGTDLDGGYTIGTLSSTQIGTISVSR